MFFSRFTGEGVAGYRFGVCSLWFGVQSWGGKREEKAISYIGTFSGVPGDWLTRDKTFHRLEDRFSGFRTGELVIFKI